MNYFKEFYIFAKDILKSRRLLIDMVKRDFKDDYLGSYLGFIWAFIQPIVTIFVLWFVFTVGFKPGKTTAGCPFILWLIAGMIPWFFFSEALLKGTSSIVVYSYLVKKVVFRVSVLPTIKICSSLIIHFALVCLMMLTYIAYGYYPTLYWLQLPYYIFCMFALVLGLSWISASLNVFTKDIGQIINVCIQIGFWGTPIFWDFSMVQSNPILAALFKLNPAFYIIQGFRDSLIYNMPILGGHWKWTLYFWCLTLFILLLGGVVFRKLRPHFADVL